MHWHFALISWAIGRQDIRQVPVSLISRKEKGPPAGGLAVSMEDRTQRQKNEGSSPATRTRSVKLKKKDRKRFMALLLIGDKRGKWSMVMVCSTYYVVVSME